MPHSPLPLLPSGPEGPHGSRSAMTCQYRCGNACDHPEPNQSGNEHVQDVITRAIARRSVIAGGAGALVVSGLVADPAAADPRHARPTPGGVGNFNFSPVRPNVRDNVIVPAGFRYETLIRWGDIVVRGAPRFDPYRQTPAAAARQFGYNNDYVGVLPLTRNRAVLVTNHEYTTEPLMFPEGQYTEDEMRRIAIQSHGMSVVEIERRRERGRWRRRRLRNARLNRRITGSTPFRVDGPAAGSPRLQTNADPTGRRALGTINNCAGGMTPWGTVLSGEENFNSYFEASGGTLDPAYAASYARYGIVAAPNNSRGWSNVDDRFDLTKEPKEPFRFGWIVEVDPFDPTSTPRKHSMLGRFKHEGANIQIADDGRAVAYMGDDERGEYLYKFVSAGRFDRGTGQAARRRNLRLLSRGTLYVAKLTGDGLGDGRYDGSGTWIPLASDTTSYVDGMSVVDVLVDTRLAADEAGGTRMDRPEDVEPNPVNGRIYAALTNNSERGTTFPVDEANPLGASRTRAAIGAPLVLRPGNRNGYVLEMTEAGGNHSGTAFSWNLMLVCGDPEAEETYFAGFPKSQVSPISCPDNVAFDKVGNLWISTDGNVLGSNDGLFRVPVSGPSRGQVEQFLTVPIGAETCGPLISADQHSVFAAVQHPGETAGSTFDNPSSTWPHTDNFPRPSVVVAFKA